MGRLLVDYEASGARGFQIPLYIVQYTYQYVPIFIVSLSENHPQWVVKIGYNKGACQSYLSDCVPIGESKFMTEVTADNPQRGTGTAFQDLSIFCYVVQIIP